MDGKGGMGGTEVSHGDRKMTDKLHATGVGDDEVPPGGLVGVVCEACGRSAGLPPLVCCGANIDPSPFAYKMSEGGEVPDISIEVTYQKGGAIRPE